MGLTGTLLTKTTLYARDRSSAYILCGETTYRVLSRPCCGHKQPDGANGHFVRTSKLDTHVGRVSGRSMVLIPSASSKKSDAHGELGTGSA